METEVGEGRRIDDDRRLHSVHHGTSRPCLSSLPSCSLPTFGRGPAKVPSEQKQPAARALRSHLAGPGDRPSGAAAQGHKGSRRRPVSGQAGPHAATRERRRSQLAEVRTSEQRQPTRTPRCSAERRLGAVRPPVVPGVTQRFVSMRAHEGNVQRRTRRQRRWRLVRCRRDFRSRGGTCRGRAGFARLARCRCLGARLRAPALPRPGVAPCMASTRMLRPILAAPCAFRPRPGSFRRPRRCARRAGPHAG